MLRVEILVGIAASKRKWFAGNKSEFCYYLRVDGFELSEETFFAPYSEIVSSPPEEIRILARSTWVNCRQYAVSKGCSCEMSFVIRNGWRNVFETGKDIRCRALPVSFIKLMSKYLREQGFVEVKK